MNKEMITVDYYSDILCVWAWISERRIEELNTHFGENILIRPRYVNIFGDVDCRIREHWNDKGLYEGFAEHVIHSAAPYESATVNPKVWRSVRPATSANAHLVLKAIETVHDIELAINAANILRQSFFVDAIDIGSLDTILRLLEPAHVNVDEVNHAINNGVAIAALMGDYQSANDYEIKGSPCFLMNEGRQVLFGNVGYRVLQANIEELLCRHNNDASWC